MMVPRSYPYLNPLSSPDRRRSSKMGARSAKASPSLSDRTRPEPSEKQDASSAAMPKLRSPEPISSAPPAHSKPVVIPPRTPSKSSTAASTQTVKSRGYHGGRKVRTPQNHRTDGIPPAVAALLAVTEIPKLPNPRRHRQPTMDRKISMDEVVQEWKQEEPDLGTPPAGSPLDVLLGRVDEDDDDSGIMGSLPENEKDSMTSRSISSESISVSSTLPPSLDPNTPSFHSTWGDPATPFSLLRKHSGERKEKVVQSPPKEDCILDHPLLHFTPDDCEEIAQLDISDITTTPLPPLERFKSFKSNLTASLQALKSAAKSFSNFTAPSVPPDDLLTRSLLSPRFTSEMRPKQLEGVPSPALRRYLNPQPAPISPTELSMQLHDALMLETDADSSAPMIQMQTYDRRNRSRGRRRSSDPFSEAGRALSPAPSVRQREPRENSDFLRVIVLEMNMRRSGKLDTKAVGKARIWLPPRKSSASPTPAQSGVPNRWVGVPAGEE